MSRAPQPFPLDDPPRPGKETLIAREFKGLKSRLIEESTVAVGMVEAALLALFEIDQESAREIVKRDDRIDREEVAIEEHVFRLMTLQAPVARDFRSLAFALKVNADIERVADHACSIAKVVMRLDPDQPPAWPTSLVEMAQRVPMMCQALLHALINEDVAASKQIIANDKTIDTLHTQLFDETVELLESQTHPQAIGLLVYRVGRELERVGDMMVNIAEDIVYLCTGEIIRHQKKRAIAARLGGDGPTTASTPR